MEMNGNPLLLTFRNLSSPCSSSFHSRHASPDLRKQIIQTLLIKNIWLETISIMAFNLTFVDFNNTSDLLLVVLYNGIVQLELPTTETSNYPEHWWTIKTPSVTTEVVLAKSKIQRRWVYQSWTRGRLSPMRGTTRVGLPSGSKQGDGPPPPWF